jgi:hypothetical protein
VLNLSLTVLQPVPLLCDYKVWIDAERDVKAKCYLRIMVEINMMEEFYARWMEEHRRAAFFARHHEMDHEEYKEKRE